MKNFVKTNKLSILILFLVFLILVFCHFQTLILNDDLPYSLYFRETNRITNLKEVIINQIFDYSHISPRVFIHVIVQSLLIFDKNLWSILNPLVICLIIILMSYILYEFTGKKTKFLYFILASTCLFLISYYYKYLVYWVAGSVNYVWIFLIMLLFILYYLKIGFIKKNFLTFFLCLIVSILCEASAIFVIVLLISDYIIKRVIEKYDRKIVIKYIVYLFAALIGFSFLMFSPSNMGRMVGFDDSWSSLNIFEKLFISIPVISLKNFNGFTFYNLFPIFWYISIVYNMHDKLCRKNIIILAAAMLFMLFGFVLNDGWFYFVFGLLLLFMQIVILFNNKDYNLIGVLIGGYAILYSLAVTPDYAASRPGFHTLLIISMFIIYNFEYLTLKSIHNLKL